MTTFNATPTAILTSRTDLERQIAWLAAMVARHPDWQQLRQLFLATLNDERIACGKERRQDNPSHLPG